MLFASRYGWAAGFAAVGGFMTYFFRDPEREVPQAEGLVVSPADGRVMVAGTVGYLILGFGLLDALYQTVTTVTTVGFREVQPLTAAGTYARLVVDTLRSGDGKDIAVVETAGKAARQVERAARCADFGLSHRIRGGIPQRGARSAGPATRRRND